MESVSAVQVLALLIFIACIGGVQLLILRPTYVQLGRFGKWHLHYAAVPPLAALLMLATTVLSLLQFWQGIVGDQYIQPYAIIILFMALAYIASSLDGTGAFAWLALQITRKSGGRGPLLFLLYYCLSSALTTFCSNDVSIMTLTPIILYCTAATSVDPIPFLVAEFTAANLWSMLLYFGNPTNIIVAQAYRMSFTGYTNWMVLPTLAAGIANLAALWLLHRRNIPKHMHLPPMDVAAQLADIPGAVFGSLNLAACLVLLAVAPAVGWPLWLVTLVCAALHFVYNLTAYVLLPWWTDSRRPQPQTMMQLELQQADRIDRFRREVSPLAPSTEEDAPAQMAITQQHARHRRHTSNDAGRDSESPAVTAPAAVAVDMSAGGLQPCKDPQHVPLAGGAGDMQRAAMQPLPPLPGGKDVDLQRRQPADLDADRAAAASPRRTSDGQQPLAAPAACAAAAAQHRRTSSSPPGTCTPLTAGAHDVRADSQLRNVSVGAYAGAAEAAAAGGEQAGRPSDGGDSLRELPPLLAPRTPTFLAPLLNLPWEVVPFTLGMFIVVQGLDTTGWLDDLASALGRASPGPLAAVAAVGSLSIVLANAMNNQPQTIFMARTLLNPRFVAAAGSDAAIRSASFAVVIASNVGANFTLIGALAGIMWASILRQRGYEMGYAKFFRLMSPLGLASAAASLVVLAVEFLVV